MLLEATLSTALKRFVFYAPFNSLLEETHSLLDMAKTVPFKFCLLDYYNENKNIRRFACPLDVLGNLTYHGLIVQIHCTYSKLHHPESNFQQPPMFSLYYIGKQTQAAFFPVFIAIFF